MARDGDNYMKSQLHRVGLDGRGDVRLTDPGFTHTVDVVLGGPCAAPATGSARRLRHLADNKYFVDIYQTHNRAPATQLVRSTRLSGKAGRRSSSTSDTSKLDALGVRRAEQFTYLAADGKTKLFGQISFPSNFDRVEEVADARQRLRRAGVGQQRADRELRDCRARRRSTDS